MKKLISIMAVWDEQNMIALSIESTKDIVYEFIIIIKKGIDKTKEVVEKCKNKWNLNMKIIESELKLRDARKYVVDISKDYADYYLIQDGDEIYLSTEQLKKLGRKTIPDIMEEDYDFYNTSMIYLKNDLKTTLINTTWLIPHPFLFKNIPEIYWPENKGDMPAILYNWKKRSYKYNEWIEKSPPFKFDCNIKNYRRQFLRQSFTQWHDTNFSGTIEEYAFNNDERVKYYLKNIDSNANLETIIDYYKNNNNDNKWNIEYNEKLYYEYPDVIKKYINLGLFKGIEEIEDLNLI